MKEANWPISTFIFVETLENTKNIILKQFLSLFFIQMVICFLSLSLTEWKEYRERNDSPVDNARLITGFRLFRNVTKKERRLLKKLTMFWYQICLVLIMLHHYCTILLKSSYIFFVDSFLLMFSRFSEKIIFDPVLWRGSKMKNE